MDPMNNPQVIWPTIDGDYHRRRGTPVSCPKNLQRIEGISWKIPRECAFIVPFVNHIVFASGRSLTCIDSLGKIKWKYVVPKSIRKVIFQHPGVEYFSECGIILGTWEGLLVGLNCLSGSVQFEIDLSGFKERVESENEILSMLVEGIAGSSAALCLGGIGRFIFDVSTQRIFPADAALTGGYVKFGSGSIIGSRKSYYNTADKISFGENRDCMARILQTKSGGAVELFRDKVFGYNRSGNRVWDHYIEPTESFSVDINHKFSSLFGDGDSAFVLTHYRRACTFFRFDATSGHVLWESKFNCAWNQVVVYLDKILVLGRREDKVVVICINKANGEIDSTITFSGGPIYAESVVPLDENRILISGDERHFIVS